MNLLMPIYLAGLGLISLPILFHLLRRSPRGTMPFSTLMFLTPSPPRVTRRSRIDDWLLLILRGLAIAMIALAFCRPYLRSESTLPWNAQPGRRVALLLDTSASMRRGDVWQRAVAAAKRELAALTAADQVALYTFDQRLTPVAPFVKDSGEAAQVDRIRQRLETLKPAWGGTRLGPALASLADQLEGLDERDAGDQPLQIVLFSDMQQGADLTALQSYEWPGRVAVRVERVVDPQSNAGVQWLAGSSESDATGVRIRVVHAAATAELVDGAQSSAPRVFQLRWRHGEQSASDAITVEVPVGESRIVKCERPADLPQADALVLEGDPAPFDSVCFAAPPLPRRQRIVFWGEGSADDPQTLRYYAQRALEGVPGVAVEFAGVDDSTPEAERRAQLDSADLVIVDGDVGQAGAESLRNTVTAGATLLLPIRGLGDASILKTLWGERAAIFEGSGEFSLFGEIDFTHPLFAPLAGPRYNDFSKIRFWRSWRLELATEDAEGAEHRVVAKFDSGAPALMERSVGAGRLLVLATTWRPAESQLALSTKFVPLMVSLVAGAGRRPLQFEVGAPIPTDALLDDEGHPATVVAPSGERTRLTADEPFYTGAQEPGVYELLADAPVGAEGSVVATRRFGVNLSATEALTTPLAEDGLSSHGVRIGDATPSTDTLVRERHRRNEELEGRQKIWQWLVAGAVLLLLAETAWAGARSRRIAQQEAGGSWSTGI